jgi:DeoR/GlpR family transcriptional regulator of sugar metabolism
MRPDERRSAILELLREQKKVTVDHLADTLDASRETIRRDLSELAISGLLRKFHGGATVPDEQTEGAFSARLHEYANEKRLVSKLAASLFSAGDTLFVDTGTTTLAFARELAASASGLTVITNSLAITQILARSANGHRVFAIGGEYRDEAAENVGPMAVAQINQFSALHAVITVGAIDEKGVMDYELEEAEIARAMIGRARRVTVIADSSKLGRTALFSVCSLREIDRLVVSAAPDGSIAQAFMAAQVEVLVP